MPNKKRKCEIASSNKSDADKMDIFRRHFERQFAPLKDTQEKLSSRNCKALPGKTGEELSDQEWEGIPDPDDGLIENGGFTGLAA